MAAHAVTYLIEDVHTGSIVGSFETDAAGDVASIAVTIGNATYDRYARSSAPLKFDDATGALESAGPGYAALTNGSGSFIRISNTATGGNIVGNWELLSGTSFDNATPVAAGEYLVSPASPTSASGVQATAAVSTVPVPASVILFGTALVGAGLTLGRRRKAAA